MNFLPKFDPKPSILFANKIIKETKIEAAIIGQIAIWTKLPDPSDHLFTKDFDLAVSKSDLIKVCSHLSKLENLSVKELLIGGVNVKTTNDVNIDFITRFSFTMGDFSKLFEDAIRSAYPIEIEGQNFSIVSTEHLIAMKIGTGEKKDENDAQKLLLNTNADIEKVRSIIFEFLGAGTLSKIEVILRDIGHLKAIPRGRYKDKP